MGSLFKEVWKAKAFIITSLLFIIIGAIILLTQEKIEFHLAVNAIHSEFLDTLFKYWTFIGDGVVAPVIILILGIVFYKKYGVSTFILGFGTLITVGILAQTLKRTVFPDALRPLGIIGVDNLHLIDGVDVHTIHSFPSGHTAAGFAFMAFLACFFFAKNQLMQIILALTAVLIGYSRMHLSQHFLEDVVTGAIVGLLAFVIVFVLSSLVHKKRSIS